MTNPFLDHRSTHVRKLTMKLLFSLAGAAALALFASQAAQAHGMLERASPRVGSTVRATPEQLQLWFTEDLAATGSMVKVIDESGRQVLASDAPGASGSALTVALPPLPAGMYRVLWRAMSSDEDQTEGDFQFQVAP
jgi:copper resistance protein C